MLSLKPKRFNFLFSFSLVVTVCFLLVPRATTLPLCFYSLSQRGTHYTLLTPVTIEKGKWGVRWDLALLVALPCLATTSHCLPTTGHCHTESVGHGMLLLLCFTPPLPSLHPKIGSSSLFLTHLIHPGHNLVALLICSPFLGFED